MRPDHGPIGRPDHGPIVRPDPRDVGLISVSLDLGAGRRGVDMGPSAIRIAGLKDEVLALGRSIKEVGTVTASAPELATEGDQTAKYLEEVHEV